MLSVLRSIAVIGMVMMIAGCNSTDALTPQADIPGESQKAETPVANPPDEAINSVDNQPVALDNADATPDRAPQNTLEAQARALENGEKNPALTDPSNTSLLGANLYKNTEAKPLKTLYSNQQVAAASGTIRFLPIIGAPVQAVTPLSRELGNSARANGLTIKSSSDQSAEHVLKGYLSAFSDGKKVTVIYVWDVLDNSGGRLHRIQGEESVPGKGADAWSAVPPELMQEIGVSTIAEYMKWKQAQG